MMSGLLNGQGGSRGRRFETYCEKDNLSIGISLSKSHSIERGIDDVHIGAIGACLQKTLAAPGHTQHVAKARDRDIGSAGQFDGAVYRFQRSNTNGAAWSMNQTDDTFQGSIDAV